MLLTTSLSGKKGSFVCPLGSRDPRTPACSSVKTNDGWGGCVPRKSGSQRTHRWREVDSNLRSPVSGDTPQRPLITSPAIIFRESSACASPQRLRSIRDDQADGMRRGSSRAAGWREAILKLVGGNHDADLVASMGWYDRSTGVGFSRRHRPSGRADPDRRRSRGSTVAWRPPL